MSVFFVLHALRSHFSTFPPFTHFPPLYSTHFSLFFASLVLAGESLTAAIDILRILTQGEHPIFEEDRLRRQQWLCDIPSETGDTLANGIDVLLRDPIEYDKMLKRVHTRQQQRKKQSTKRAKQQVKKRKAAAKKAVEREKKRRAQNAALLVSGKTYDIKTKKFWFENWTVERFAAIDDDFSYTSFDGDGGAAADKDMNRSKTGSSLPCCCGVQ